MESLTEQSLMEKTPDFVVKTEMPETTETPQFHHHQMNWLYEYGYEIPTEYINEILALNRETLLPDLKKVLNDGVTRYKVFKEDDFHTQWFPLHALYLFRELKATESLEVILNFLSLNEEFLDFWLGDLLTADIWSVLMVCGNQNLNRLKTFAMEPAYYLYSRTEVAEAVSQMALHEIISKQEAIEWLKDVLGFCLLHKDNKDIGDYLDFNGLLICDCLDLRAVELLPLIKQMFDEGMVNPGVCGIWKDVEKEMNTPAKPHYKHKIETIFEAYQLFNSRDNEEKYDELQDDDENTENDRDYSTDGTFVREEPKISRNALCPCGSGKKYKKCHGA